MVQEGLRESSRDELLQRFLSAMNPYAVKQSLAERVSQ